MTRVVAAPLWLAACLWLAQPCPARAQSVAIGDRIRVSTPRSSLRGDFTGVAGDSVLIRRDGYHVSTAVCTCDLVEVGVGTGRSGLVPSALVGAVVGAAAGPWILDSDFLGEAPYLVTSTVVAAAILTFPIVLAIGDDGESSQRVVGAAFGALVGVGVGWLAPEHWRWIDPGSLVVAPAGDGDAGLFVGLSAPF